MVFLWALLVDLLVSCTSGTAIWRDSAASSVDSSLSSDVSTNIFQGFDWQNACSTMLGGNANITVNDGANDGATDTDQCIPVSACGLRGIYLSELYLSVAIWGVRSQGRPCHISILLPLDSSGTVSNHQYAFDPLLAESSDPVVVQSYHISGYDEQKGGDSAAYPEGPSFPVWTGSCTIESLPPVGGMLTGAFIYQGTDDKGEQRNVDATFSAPRYPDSTTVILPDGGVP